MSHDDFWQYILNPMLNPVSCDRRGTFCMFPADTCTLLLTASKPRQAETATSVAKTLVLSTSQLYIEKDIASTNTTPSLFRVAGAVDSNLMRLSKGAIIPPWGCLRSLGI